MPKIAQGISEDEMNYVHSIKKTLYSDNIKYAKRNNHLFNIIEQIRNQYFIALVTNANRKNATEILEAFSDKNRFDLIITHEDIKTPKPSPDSFEIAMDYFKVTSKQTIVLRIPMSESRLHRIAVQVISEFMDTTNHKCRRNL